MRQCATIWSYFVNRPRRALDRTLPPVPRVRVEHQLTVNRLDFNPKESIKAALSGLCRPTSTGDEAPKVAIPSDDITMKEKLNFLMPAGLLKLNNSNLGVTSLEGFSVFKGSCGVVRNLGHALRTGLSR